MKELDGISRRARPPTLKEIGDSYIEAVVRHSRSLSEAARRLGISYKGLRLRASREDASEDLREAIQDKITARDA